MLTLSPRGAAARRTRPSLETLERRDCPSVSTIDQLWYMLNTSGAAVSAPAQNQSTSPVIGSGTPHVHEYGVSPIGITMTVVYNQKMNVTINGTVTDSKSSPAGLTVTLTGKVSGSATTDANGKFSLTTDATGLGNFTAKTTDALGNTGSGGAALQVNPPSIDTFDAIEGPANSLAISGHVTDINPQGLTVTYNGIGAPDGGYNMTCLANGNFNGGLILPPGNYAGMTVSAVTTNWWGLTSPIAYDMI